MSKQQEAQQFLNDLDSLNAPSTSQPTETASGAANLPNEAEALAFLDEITQKSSELTKPTVSPLQPRTVTPRASSRISLRKGAEGVSRSESPAPALPTHPKTPSELSSSGDRSAETPSAPTAGSDRVGSWGWGSVWSSASAAVRQARNVVDEQVKNLPKNEQAKKWSEGMLEYVKGTQFDKFGQDLKTVGLSTFNDILNVVAPPIAEHEVIQVWLSHDMRGYEGVESLVYQALAKVMEQVDGGDLVVNKGNESRPKGHTHGLPERDLGAVEGFDAAFKLAKANVDEMVKNDAQKSPTRSPATTSNPTIYSSVYLCIQPYLTSISSSGTSQATPSATLSSKTHLQFLIYLTSPSHEIIHITTTQTLLSRWVDAFQTEDVSSGDANSWVEDVLVDVLRVGVEVIGQEYIADRMGWGQPAANRPATSELKDQEKEANSSLKSTDT